MTPMALSEIDYEYEDDDDDVCYIFDRARAAPRSPN